ncbi:MAG: RHS repeat-associated core domain-containing protein [Acidobacteriota bacterium]
MAAQAKLLHLCLAAFCLPAFANVPRGLLLTEKLHQGGESFVLPSHRGSTAFTEGAVSETNNYDSFGNRWVTTVRGLVADPLTPAGPGWFSAASNQMTGVPYDAAGNQIQFNPYTMSYDAEGRVVSATSAANGSAVYAYDGEGRRVKKIVNGNATTVYVYDGLGRLAAEYGAGSGGSGLGFLTEDHLGSVRLVTGPLGNVIRRHDYRPFGQDLSGVNGRGPRYGDSRNVKRYTGKERDAETGLDYFESRYFSSAQGRFTSPDVLMGKPEWLVDPQRWNRYAYVRNNPLKYIDPNGEDLVIYYSLGSDVSDADREWFNKNKSAILGAIQAKYEKAGVKNVSLRDLSTLSKDQIAALDKGSPFGVSRLTFVGKDYPGLGQAPAMGVLGYAHPDGKRIAGVFLDTFPKVSPSGCDQACIAGDVAAHELGHTIGIPHLGVMEEMADRWRQRPGLLGGTETRPDLMTGSMGVPTQPLYFKPGTNERTQRAIEQLNRIGDMTPKK